MGADGAYGSYVERIDLVDRIELALGDATRAVGGLDREAAFAGL